MKRLLTTTILFVALTASARTPNRPAPDFTLPARSGTVSLHDLRGKVVYVDFWASWCAPCRQSFPWMRSMDEKYKKDGLVIVAVNLDKDVNAAEGFIQQFTPPFTIAFDPAGKTADAYNVQVMPSSFIVDRTGAVVYAHEGFEESKSQAIEEKIKEALKP